MRTVCTLNIELPQRKKVYWLLQYFIIISNVVFHTVSVYFLSFSHGENILILWINCNTCISLKYHTWKWQVESISRSPHFTLYIFHLCVHVGERSKAEKQLHFWTCINIENILIQLHVYYKQYSTWYSV